MTFALVSIRAGSKKNVSSYRRPSLLTAREKGHSSSLLLPPPHLIATPLLRGRNNNRALKWSSQAVSSSAGALLKMRMGEGEGRERGWLTSRRAISSSCRAASFCYWGPTIGATLIVRSVVRSFVPLRRKGGRRFDQTGRDSWKENWWNKKYWNKETSSSFLQTWKCFVVVFVQRLFYFC